MKSDNTIIRVEKRERYVVLDKYFLEEDNRISWKATAILAYLLAKPNGWEVRVKDLINRKTDGRDSVRAGLRELIQAGYLERRPNRDETGKFHGYIYVIHEKPVKPKSPETENPAPDKPSPGKPAPENPPLVNYNNLVNINNKLNKQQQQNPVVVVDNNSEKKFCFSAGPSSEEVDDLRSFAEENGIEMSERFAAAYIAAAGSVEAAKELVVSCASYIAREKQNGHEIGSVAAILNNASKNFLTGAAVNRNIVWGLSSKEDKKEDKYRDLYLT